MVELKVGDIFTALMQRMQRGEVLFEIGKATAIMPQEEQIPNEFYRLGDRYKVLLKDIVDSQMIVSRSDPDFLVGLFKLEVPEIESGVLEVKAIAKRDTFVWTAIVIESRSITIKYIWIKTSLSIK